MSAEPRGPSGTGHDTTGVTPAPDRSHIVSERDPLDWYIEVCAVCGCQLGPGIGTRTRTGRCVDKSHWSTGGIVVRVAAKPLAQQKRKYPVLARLGVPDA